MLAALRSFWSGRRAMSDPLIAVVGATGTGKSKVLIACPLPLDLISNRGSEGECERER